MAKRSKVKRERDLVDIEYRYLRGESQSSIAANLGVSQPTVSNDIKELVNRWKDATVFDLDAMKTQELIKINNLETTYWEAWNKSCQDAETNTQRRKAMLNKETDELLSVVPVEQSRTRKAQTGDPRYLEGVQWCITKRCELLGLDAPTQVNMNICKAVGFDVNEV